eukprot:3303104-Rhodomonas_salina.1
MEQLKGITENDTKIITILKTRVQEASVQRYWDAIPGHQDMLISLHKMHERNKKRGPKHNPGDGFYFKLSIVYTVETTVAIRVKDIAKSARSEMTRDEFRKKFVSTFPDLFWNNYSPN